MAMSGIMYGPPGARPRWLIGPVAGLLILLVLLLGAIKMNTVIHEGYCPGVYQWRADIESGRTQLGTLIGPNVFHYC